MSILQIKSIFAYKGNVDYRPIISKTAKMEVEFPITVKGRSKAQRFDIE